MLSVLVAFAVRCLLVGLFLPFSALDKILNFKAAVGQANEAIPSRGLAKIAIFAGLGVEVLMSLAILTVPTMLMGATLPFLVKSLTRSQTDLANRIGFLYGFNTLGAATGTLLVGFLLL